MWGLQESVYVRELRDEGDIVPEHVRRGTRGFREVGAVEWIGVVQELNFSLEHHGGCIARVSYILLVVWW